jgi:hypothetical protein
MSRILNRRPALACAGAGLLAAAAIATAPSLAADASSGCPSGTVDLGSWCLDTAPQAVPAADAGGANYFYASARCAGAGGYLPQATALIGAASKVKLAGRLDDDPAKALQDTDASDGLDDWREMTATLITTRGGSAAGGTLGVSDTAKGDPRQGEPDPAPVPAETSPDSIQYLTVIDNGDRGGFAGARPVSEAERFRCAYNKSGAVTSSSSPTTTSPTTATKSITVRAADTAHVASLAKGLAARVSCPKGCSYLVELDVPAPNAWRAGLAKRIRSRAVLAVSGKEASQLDAGSAATVRLKPAAAVRGALKRAVAPRGKSVTARVRVQVQATGATSKQTISQKVRLVR